MSDLEIDFFLIDYTSVGGVERVTDTLIKLFMHNGIKVNNLFSLRASNVIPHFPFSKEMNFVTLECDKNQIEDKLYKQIIKLNTKILLFQGDNMSISLAVLKAAKRANIIAIPQYHGSPFAYLKKYIGVREIVNNPLKLLNLTLSAIQYPFKKDKLKKFLENSEYGVACVSYGSANELKELFNKNEKIKSNIFTIYNPISITAQKINLSDKKNHVVYISRLENKHKNSFLALRSWSRIANQFPEWELHILGDGSLKKKMELYAKNNIIKNVIFHGFVSNVTDYLKESKISILSSNCEGLGMGVLESIVHSNVIVATKSDGGISDLVIDNKTGFLVDKNDDKNFSLKLKKLIEDEELTLKFIKESNEILEKFDNNDILNKWKKTLYFAIK